MRVRPEHLHAGIQWPLHDQEEFEYKRTVVGKRSHVFFVKLGDVIDR